jgi:uncharacterized metal-binding protein
MSNNGCGNGEQLIFTCAGAAYCGQLANRSGVQAATEGLGKLFCLAVVSARREEKMQRVWQAGRRIAIDGCDEDCARRTLELAGVPVSGHVRITDLGIEKQPAEPRWLVDTKRVVAKVREVLGGSQPDQATAPKTNTCCCQSKGAKP